MKLLYYFFFLIIYAFYFKKNFLTPYAKNELFAITDFTKQISSLVKDIKNHSIEKIGILKNNRLEVVILSTQEYSRLKKIKQESKEQKWTYWRDEELDNFGKISIGLSRYDYDNEDYSKK